MSSLAGVETGAASERMPPVPSNVRPLAHLAAALAAALCLSLLAAPASEAASRSAGCAHAHTRGSRQSLQAFRHSVLCLLNAERRRVGLRRVRVSRRLQRSANAHSHEMVKLRYFSHDSAAAGPLSSRVHRAGYLKRAAGWQLGEALEYVDRAVTPARLFRKLMRSPAHAALVWSPAFRQIGVGLERGAPDGRRAGMTLTLNFGVVTARR